MLYLILAAGNGKAADIAMPLEFPEISSNVTGLENRYVFSVGFTLREGPQGFMDCLQKIDLVDKKASALIMEKGSTYFHEPVFVSRQGTTKTSASGKEDDGYIIASAYIPKRHATGTQSRERERKGVRQGSKPTCLCWGDGVDRSRV